ncbi:hypothetical protein [Nocardioides daejeonensis]|uniref:hypothetical protein n=1 Tax=Nocardioides daejeonensis TaxID=1046556 RepID=UPI000D7489F4|nr:hypothetical protein [Nocardioides daejeonensis]
MTSDYRLAPPVAARLLGVSIAGFGLLIFLVTGVVVLLSAPVAVLWGAVVVSVVGIFAVGALLTRTGYVLRLTDDGYRVRLVRGAGVKQARWADVEELVTDTVAGAPCLIFRLRGGEATVLPVQVLAGDREELVREVGSHLARGR